MKDNYKEGMTCPPGSFAYTIKSGDTLYQLANKYDTTVAAIMAMNPGLDPNNLKIGQVICIPRSAPPTPPCPNGFLYTIKSGDTIFKLSQQFGVPVEAIIQANPGINPDNLQVGQVICIPRGTSPTPPCPNGFLYTIRPGDTIWRLSQQFGVSVEAIIRANPGINPDNLQIGQEICIPHSAPPTPQLPPCPNGFYYTILAGDSLYSISRKFNVPVQEIQHANPGIDPNNLRIGQVICIPRRCAVFCF